MLTDNADNALYIALLLTKQSLYFSTVSITLMLVIALLAINKSLKVSLSIA